MARNIEQIMKDFKPTPKEVIDRVTAEIFRESRIVKQDRFVGAGRRFGDRGTPGYKDNLLHVDGYDVKAAIVAARRRHPDRPVILADVGCANGQGLVDIIRFANRYQGIPVDGIGITANPKEYLTNPPSAGNPPLIGMFASDGDYSRFTFDVVKKNGSLGKGIIRYRALDIHRLLPEFSPDVTMSMACIKYSHDPWKIFASFVRQGDPDGHLFIGHLLDGTGDQSSKQPIFRTNGVEMSPREYIDEFLRLNQALMVVCNENRLRQVTNESGEKVYNRRKFYAGDSALNSFRESLIAIRKNKSSSGEQKSMADRELLRVSGNGFFNVSVKRNGIKDPYFGLLHVGDTYGRNTQYLFVPDNNEFVELVKRGYVPV